MPATTQKKRRTKPDGNVGKKRIPTARNGKQLRVDDAHNTPADDSQGRKTKSHESPDSVEHENWPPDVIAFELPVERIAVVCNDRTVFDPAKLKQLAASIKSRGVIEPLVVSPGDVGPGVTVHRLIAGERRLRAAKLAGLKTVPVVVRDYDLKNIAVARLEENLQREDLNPIERATALRNLIDDHGMTQKEVAKLVGCTQAQISNAIGVLELPEIWQQWVAAGKLAATSVRPLRPWAKKRPQVLQQLVDDHASDIDEGKFELSDQRIGQAVENCTRPVRTAMFSEHFVPRKSDCHFRCSAKNKDEIADLDIEEVPNRWGMKEARAWNVDRWEERNKPAFEKRKKQYRDAQKKREAQSGGGSKSKGKNAAKATVNSFDLKRAVTDQIRAALLERLSFRTHKAKLPALLLYIGGCETGVAISEQISEQSDHGTTWLDPSSIASVLGKIDPKKLPSFAFGFVEKLIAAGAYEGVQDADELLAFATLCGIDLISDWKPSVEVLSVFPTERLAELLRDVCRMGDFDPTEWDSHESAVAILRDNWPPGTLCDEIKEAMGVQS
jgi:ParB/RepB/Spo0J family partition protein